MGLGNKLIVSATGFPGTNKTLRFIQDAFREPLGALAQMAGEKTILTGVVNTAGVVSDGFIVYQGEIIPFTGGAYANTVTIIEQFENVNYNTDANDDTVLDSLPAYRTIYAKCGTGGIDIFNFSELYRLRTLKDLQPIGTIQMWGGTIASIPSGWKLCDGTNGTPNLIDRFIVGAGNNYNVGDVGGLDSVQLAQQNLPNYNLSGTTSSNGSHTHGYRDGYYVEHYTGGFGSEYIGGGNGGSGDTDGDNQYIWYKDRVTNSSGAHTHSVSINSNGGNLGHENRPPYFALCYIMYVGI